VNGVPTNTYQAAAWLRERHPWLDQLVRRIAGNSEDWLDEIAGAVLDLANNAEAWDRYELHHPEPGGDDERAWEAWQAAGPEHSAHCEAFAVMSSGEQRVIRLVATLAQVYEGDYGRQRLRRVPWSVQDISFDERGAAILADWLAIVRAQLPEHLYTSRGGAA